MPRLLDDRLVGLQMADLVTRSYDGVNVGDVLQVAPDGISLIIAPLPAGVVGVTGPTGPGVGSAGPTGPAGPSTASLAGLKTVLITATQTWTVPVTVNNIIINAVGGGGGGGVGAEASTEFVGSTGVTGQSGGSARISAQVIPNTNITITVGAGGTGQSVINPVTNSQNGTNTVVSWTSPSGPQSLVCGGGLAAYGEGGIPTFPPGSRASTTPTNLLPTPLLGTYGMGGTGVIAQAGRAGNGQSGAILFEYVELT